MQPPEFHCIDVEQISPVANKATHERAHKNHCHCLLTVGKLKMRMVATILLHIEYEI